MTRFLAVFLATLAFFVIAPVILAPAQQVIPGCNRAIDLYRVLRGMGEISMFTGDGPQGSVSLLMQNPKSSSWTFFLVDPRGCLVYSIGGASSMLSPAAKGAPL